MFHCNLTVLNSGANWQMELDFNIYGEMGKLFGDGIALWFTKEVNPVGE
jgi:hypothetical protein